MFYLPAVQAMRDVPPHRRGLARMPLHRDALTQPVLGRLLPRGELICEPTEGLALRLARTDQLALLEVGEAHDVSEEFVQGVVLVGEDDDGSDGLAFSLGGG